MTITVLSPGLITTVQDLGRPGLAAVGVSASGAFDRSALKLANRLVGNYENTAGLETLGSGLRIVSDTPQLMAITGATGDIFGATGHGGHNSPFVLPAQTPLEIGPRACGLRTYLSFRGGLAVEPILGSRSWDSLGRIGPEPLTAGSLLPVGIAAPEEPRIDIAPVPSPPSGAVTLTVDPGPRHHWFTSQSWEILASGKLSISPESDRVGLRLMGGQITRSQAYLERSLASEGLVRGAIEVPPDGLPIILGVDHPTTGGYPVIAVIAAEEYHQCAQLTPGQPVRLMLR